MAAGFCLGNDEAYYYTYALYPALSHFDHPPMVGWVIQLFSLNLYFNSEFFIRLAAVVAGTMNTWLMYCIGKQLRDELTGWYAALLYTASIYGFVIVGVFILPDSPQSVFWLSAILMLLKAFTGETDKTAKRRFLLASLFMGLALMSKYTTAYLWLGMIIYILVYNRKWLTIKEFYLAHLVMALLFLPVIIWNAQNGFVSFLFHSGRVEPGASSFTPDYFLTEVLGEALYTNPVVLVLIVIAIFSFFRKKIKAGKPQVELLVWASLPLIVTFLIVSIFRRTLPHWNGAGYMTLLPLAALWLRNRSELVFPSVIKGALVFMILIITLSTAQIVSGFIPIDKIVKNTSGNGSADYSLEVFGWRQLHDKFIPLADRYEKAGLMPAGAPIVSYRWFPAANYSYYAARGTDRYVIAAGDTSDIHKYAWINQVHGGFRLNTDAWYITSSRDFKHPRSMLKVYYEKVLPPDTISVMRMGKPVYYFYVYRLKNLQSKR
jgi:4-amino-4-deoxy-L-arabinose transferase-like glycosyltransferase